MDRIKKALSYFALPFMLPFGFPSVHERKYEDHLLIGAGIFMLGFMTFFTLLQSDLPLLLMIVIITTLVIHSVLRDREYKKEHARTSGS